MAGTNSPSFTSINIPTRKEVPKEYQWDLSSLFPDDRAWEDALKEYQALIQQIPSFQGTLSASVQAVKTCLDFMTKMGILEERLAYYAHLRLSEDGGDSSNQDRWGRYLQLATQAEAKAGFLKPELQVLPEEFLQKVLSSLPEYRVMLQKILRYKPHTLNASEERLLALQQEANQTAEKAFSALTDVDFDFGTIPTPEGERPLSHSTFQSFMMHSDRNLREAAYRKYMKLFNQHKNTLCSLYEGSVQLDIYVARVRNFPTALHVKLFPDAVPPEVYHNLIQVVHEGLPLLHRYYHLRKRVLRLPHLKMWDTKAPLIPDIKVRHTYEEAVQEVLNALSPLGAEYCSVLKEGLLGGWVDRYENRGKRSGAFSAGTYTGNPYILMNYKEDVLRDVFTLAHEAGHSMHSYYSARNNPFQHYNYTIVEAETASTFNEQLLMHYLKQKNTSEEFLRYLTSKHIDDIIGTFFRQTMFAEFELHCHTSVEEGKPLTVESLRHIYRNLLVQYFGDALVLEEEDDLEGLRIPHFYRSFYVYKYATGLSAAISLSNKVLIGEETERNRYIQFLKTGGSLFPLDSLLQAGVDLKDPQTLRETLQLFKSLLTELEDFYA
ncbi:MAG: oligoendopeptidase F [Spirochaetales bacterium]